MTAQTQITAEIKSQAVALIAKRGYGADQVKDIELDANGNLASVFVGCDDDGMARYVLNFAL